MKPVIYLITGVMAAGKSTVGQLLAEQFLRGVHLRGDVFRKMIVSGREEMSGDASQEAVEQLHLRYALSAAAAKGYWEAGFTVVLQDNYYGEEWPRMIERLSGLPVRPVVLCPPAEVVADREQRRGKTGYVGFEVHDLCRGFAETTPRVGFWLDNGRMTPEETVAAILAHWPDR